MGSRDLAMAFREDMAKVSQAPTVSF